MKQNKDINKNNTYPDSDVPREDSIEGAALLNIVNSDLSPSPNLNKDEIQNLITSLNNSNISSLNGNKDLYNDINSKLEAINKLLINNSTSSPETSETGILKDLLGQITTINSLKLQINELPFSPFERIYVENCINPLLTIFYQLAISAASIKDTSQSLSLSTTTKRKTHKIKRYERTTYELMDQIDCIHDILKDRIYDFIEIICKCK
ncbi:hypothetical protein [Clostridium sp.]|uniref:hypothetical protein n=1 Tax=Clostridium sp. TaxID=1506 RepID=UPI002FCBD67D